MTSSPAVFLVLLLFWLLVADGELQGQLRIAVCLLGQVGRTEMESKVNNLVRPNLADNVTLDLYLVLQPGARFSNNPSPDCKIAPKSVQAVVDRFAKLLPTFAIDNPRLDLEVNADTWVDYHEKGSDLEKRLSNHVNQYHAWHRCARAIENHEIAAGVTYDAVLRLRDNALVLKPFLLRACLREHARNWYNTRQEEPPHPITNAHLRGLPVIVKKCCSWGGYHDKVCSPAFICLFPWEEGAGVPCQTIGKAMLLSKPALICVDGMVVHAGDAGAANSHGQRTEWACGRVPPHPEEGGAARHQKL